MNLSDSLIELERIQREYSKRGWDGEDADPVSDENYKSALRFFALLPDNIEGSEPSADPDGEICFDWFWDTSYFSISVGKQLAYAGNIDGERFHGRENFGEAIPLEVLGYLGRVPHRQIH